MHFLPIMCLNYTITKDLFIEEVLNTLLAPDGKVSALNLVLSTIGKFKTHSLLQL